MPTGHVWVLIGEDVGNHKFISEACVEGLVHLEGGLLDHVIVITRVEYALDTYLAHEADTVLTGSRVEKCVIHATDANDVEAVVIYLLSQLLRTVKSTTGRHVSSSGTSGTGGQSGG